MDPDANLTEQRQIAARIIEAYDNDRGDRAIARDAARLAELAIALDEWISAGGFMPAAWEPKS